MSRKIIDLDQAYEEEQGVVFFPRVPGAGLRKNGSECRTHALCFWFCC